MLGWWLLIAWCCCYELLKPVVVENVSLPLCTAGIDGLLWRPATASWCPGDEELEQASLAISLLSKLPGMLLPRSGGPLAGGHEQLSASATFSCFSSLHWPAGPLQGVTIAAGGHNCGLLNANNAYHTSCSHCHSEKYVSQLLQPAAAALLCHGICW